jgi:hypothetical protein
VRDRCFTLSAAELLSRSEPISGEEVFTSSYSTGYYHSDDDKELKQPHIVLAQERLLPVAPMPTMVDIEKKYLDTKMADTCKDLFNVITPEALAKQCQKGGKPVLAESILSDIASKLAVSQAHGAGN